MFYAQLVAYNPSRLPNSGSLVWESSANTFRYFPGPHKNYLCRNAIYARQTFWARWHLANQMLFLVSKPSTNSLLTLVRRKSPNSRSFFPQTGSLVYMMISTQRNPPHIWEPVYLEASYTNQFVGLEPILAEMMMGLRKKDVWLAWETQKKRLFFHDRIITVT